MRGVIMTIYKLIKKGKDTEGRLGLITIRG